MKIGALYKKYKRVVNYLIVGGLTTLVSFLSYFLCIFTFLNPQNGWHLQAANIISWVCAVTFAYFTNRKYVFGKSDKNIFLEAFYFYVSRLGTLGLEMFIMFIFVTAMGMHNGFGKVVAQIIVMVSNYFVSKAFVFRKRKELEKEINKKF